MGGSLEGGSCGTHDIALIIHGSCQQDGALNKDLKQEDPSYMDPKTRSPTSN